MVKEGSPPIMYVPAPHFLVRPTTLHCFVYFQVNNDDGVWSFLDYVEDICRSPSSPFFKSLTQTFRFYRYMMLQVL